jgi:hypothetical protein
MRFSDSLASDSFVDASFVVRNDLIMKTGVPTVAITNNQLSQAGSSIPVRK